MLTMMAAFAEFERNLVSERTSVALAHKRSKGQAYNHTPFGFNREGDLMVENPEEQRTIMCIQQWREQGKTLQGIADRLNGDQVPTKKGAEPAAHDVRIAPPARQHHPRRCPRQQHLHRGTSGARVGDRKSQFHRLISPRTVTQCSGGGGSVTGCPSL